MAGASFRVGVIPIITEKVRYINGQGLIQGKRMNEQFVKFTFSSVPKAFPLREYRQLKGKYENESHQKPSP